ncbi:hypothetical protein Z042_08560 [Chania multitudinisentens RB-25]|uniref:Flagellar biosynthesis protein FlgN n=1 Tax=Chania multitudinisentens RB-25 TaxID=1441930 RepID=W0L7E3_9GAMM|nr:flagellar protein FlgN [Chania multitudinisentens]AHG19666.1 hypothetical protein Z042_08560 [Chania multitudinisentens RB-25]
MSNAAQCVKTLIEGLIKDRQHYIALNSLLQRQRNHIIARAAAELDEVNRQIMVIYQELTQHSQQRYRLLETLGIPVSSQGVQRLITRLPDTHRSAVATLWQDLQKQATSCHTANEYNGRLMNMQESILTNIINAGEPENWLYQQV